MGHNSGLEHSGAKGKRKSRGAEVVLAETEEAEANAPLDQSEVMEALEKRELSAVRQLAREHTDKAIKVLSSLMRSTKVAASARIQAAKAILEYGHGRPGAQYQQQGSGGSGDSLKVVIFKLGEGTKEEVKFEKNVTLDGEVTTVEGVEVLRLAE
jgi:hypothetical protein